MADPNDKLTLLYNTLKADPLYKNSGLGNSVESFQSYFSDPKNGQKLYATLSNDPTYKNSGLGSNYNSFSDYFGLKKKDYGESIPSSIALPKNSETQSTSGLPLKSATPQSPQQQAKSQVQNVINTTSPENYNVTTSNSGTGDNGFRTVAQKGQTQRGANYPKETFIQTQDYTPVSNVAGKPLQSPTDIIKETVSKAEEAPVMINNEDEFEALKNKPDKTPKEFNAMVNFATKSAIATQNTLDLYSKQLKDISEGKFPEFPVIPKEANITEPSKEQEDKQNYKLDLAGVNPDLPTFQIETPTHSIGSLEYIAGEAYNSSIVGLSDAIYNKKYRIDPELLSQYDSNWLEDASAQGMSLLLDAWTFESGKAASIPLRALADKIVSNQAKKYAEIGLSEEIANQLTKNTAVKIVKGIELTKGQIAKGIATTGEIAGSGLGFGVYASTHDALSQFAENPNMNFSDWKWRQSLQKGIDDFKLGVGLGILGKTTGLISAKATQIQSDPLRFGTQLGIKTTGFGAENALFLYGGAYFDGKDFDDITGKDWAMSVATLAGMKVPGAITSIKGFKQSLDYSPDKKYDAMYGVEYTPLEQNTLTNETKVKDVNDIHEHFTQPENIKSLVENSNIPLQLKAKVLWQTNGVKMDADYTTNDINVNNNIVSFTNKDNELIDSRQYSSPDEANQAVSDYAKIIVDRQTKDKATSLSPVERIEFSKTIGEMDKDMLNDALNTNAPERNPEQQLLVDKFSEKLDKFINQKQKENEKEINETGGRWPLRETGRETGTSGSQEPGSGNSSDRSEDIRKPEDVGNGSSRTEESIKSKSPDQQNEKEIKEIPVQGEGLEQVETEKSKKDEQTKEENLLTQGSDIDKLRKEKGAEGNREPETPLTMNTSMEINPEKEAKSMAMSAKEPKEYTLSSGDLALKQSLDKTKEKINDIREKYKVKVGDEKLKQQTFKDRLDAAKAQVREFVKANRDALNKKTTTSIVNKVITAIDRAQKPEKVEEQLNKLEELIFNTNLSSKLKDAESIQKKLKGKVFQGETKEQVDKLRGLDVTLLNEDELDRFKKVVEGLSKKVENTNELRNFTDEVQSKINASLDKQVYPEKLSEDKISKLEKNILDIQESIKNESNKDELPAKILDLKRKASSVINAFYAEKAKGNVKVVGNEAQIGEDSRLQSLVDFVNDSESWGKEFANAEHQYKQDQLNEAYNTLKGIDFKPKSDSTGEDNSIIKGVKPQIIGEVNRYRMLLKNAKAEYLKVPVADMAPEIAKELANGNIPIQMYRSIHEMEKSIIMDDLIKKITPTIKSIGDNSILSRLKSFAPNNIKKLNQREFVREASNLMMTQSLHDVDQFFGLHHEMMLSESLTGIIKQGVTERGTLTNNAQRALKTAIKNVKPKTFIGETEYKRNMAIIDIAASILDHVTNLDKRFTISPEPNKPEKFRILNEDGKVVESLTDLTYQEAREKVDSKMENLMKDPKELDLYHLLKEAKKDKEVRLTKNESYNQWLLDRHKEAYEALLKASKSLTGEDYVLIKNREDLINTLKKAGLNGKWLKIYEESRKFLDDNKGYAQVVAARNGIEWKDRGPDYWPGLSMDMVKMLTDAKTIDDVLAFDSGGLYPEMGSIHARTGALHYRMFDAERNMDVYARDLFGAYCVGNKIDQTLGSLRDTVKHYEKNQDEQARNIYSAIRDNTEKRIMAWRIGGNKLFADGIAKVANFRFDYGKVLRDAISAEKYFTLTKIHRFLAEYPANIASGFSVMNNVKYLSLGSEKLKDWYHAVDSLLKGSAVASSEVIGMRANVHGVEMDSKVLEELANKLSFAADPLTGGAVYRSKFCERYKELSGEEFDPKKFDDQDYWDAHILDLEKAMRNANAYHAKYMAGTSMYDRPIAFKNPFPWSNEIWLDMSDKKRHDVLYSWMTQLAQVPMNESRRFYGGLKDFVTGCVLGDKETAFMGAKQASLTFLSSNIYTYMMMMGSKAFATGMSYAILSAMGDDDEANDKLQENWVQLKNMFSTETALNSLLVNGVTLGTQQYGGMSRMAMFAALSSWQLLISTLRVKDVKSKQQAMINDFTNFIAPVWGVKPYDPEGSPQKNLNTIASLSLGSKAIYDYVSSAGNITETAWKLSQGKQITQKESAMLSALYWTALIARPPMMPNIAQYLKSDMKNEFNDTQDMYQYIKHGDWSDYVDEVLTKEATVNGEVNANELKKLKEQRWKKFVYLQDAGTGNRIANKVLSYNMDQTKLLQYLKNEKKSMGTELFNKKIEPLRSPKTKYNPMTGEQTKIKAPISFDVQDQIDAFEPNK